MLALSACVLIAVAQTPAADLDRLQGTWQLLHAETDGKTADPANLAKVRVTIEGSAHTVHFGDEVVADKVKVEIDEKSNPPSTTDTLEDGRKIRGIYRLDGDVLISCVGPVDGERPTEFTAPAGSKRTLRVFRRAGTPEHEKAVAEELERLAGRWTYERGAFAGKELSRPREDAFREFAPDGRAVWNGSQGRRAAIFLVDPTEDPATMDTIFLEGKIAFRLSRGIYRLEGDSLQISEAPPGRPRPGFLGSPAGTDYFFNVLVRQPATP
jgi:uncharacterized protein (TIGR03067 family)